MIAREQQQRNATATIPKTEEFLLEIVRNQIPLLLNVNVRRPPCSWMTGHWPIRRTSSNQIYLTNQDFYVCMVDKNDEENNSVLAGRPLSLPFCGLPRRLGGPVLSGRRQPWLSPNELFLLSWSVLNCHMMSITCSYSFEKCITQGATTDFLVYFLQIIKTPKIKASSLKSNVFYFSEMFFLQPVLGGNPVLSGHLAIPRGWPLNTGSTVTNRLTDWLNN